MLNLLFHLDFSGTPASSINGSILIPFIVICVGLIIREGIKRRWGFTKTIFVASFAIYLFALAEILFFSIPFVPHEIVEARQFSHPRMNLVPFVDMLSQNTSIIFRNLIGNTVIFIPLGFFIPVLIKAESVWKKTIAIVFFTAILVEVVQFIGSFIIFKISWKVVDVDDVIMNILGGMIGLAAYLITEKLFKVSQDETDDIQMDCVIGEVNK